MRTARRYERTGLLAIDPTAFFELFFVDETKRDNEVIDNVASVVTIRGPLDQHDDGWCDSYESILARIDAACIEPAPAIILRIDSPGGEASGCFETARSIRQKCAAAGKPLYAYVDGKAASAAYAIGSAAQKIWLGDTAIVGSIGVLATRRDYSQMLARDGIRMAFIASGARKADGHPDNPITEAELVAQQQLVDSMAAVFFTHVSEMRGLSVDAISAQQARVYHGQLAIGAGLADAAGLTWQATLAMVASGGDALMADDKKEPEGSDYDTARESLERAAKGNDANARAAKRALAALDKDEDPAAEGGGDDKDDKNKEGGDSASASAHVSAVRALADNEKFRAEIRAEMRAELAADRENTRRETLIAARPDISAELRTMLQSSKTPLKLVEETLASIPTPGKPAGPPKGVSAADALAALHVRSPISDSRTEMLDEQKRQLDIRMGLVKADPKQNDVKNTEFKLTLGDVAIDENTKLVPTFEGADAVSAIPMDPNAA